MWRFCIIFCNQLQKIPTLYLPNIIMWRSHSLEQISVPVWRTCHSRHCDCNYLPVCSKRIMTGKLLLLLLFYFKLANRVGLIICVNKRHVSLFSFILKQCPSRLSHITLLIIPDSSSFSSSEMTKCFYCVPRVSFLTHGWPRSQ